jgi:hypothetical protein
MRVEVSRESPHAGSLSGTSVSPHPTDRASAVVDL